MYSRILAVALSILAAVAMALPASAADTLTVDQVHSSVVFRIEHNGAAPFFGRFNDKSGTIMLDSADPSKSSIEFTIDPASVDTGNEKRDGHVMSQDFFSAKEFPVMSFKSTSVSKSGEGSWKVKGMLELRGVKKEITINVNHKLGKGMKGEAVHGFYTEFAINRMDFNIGETFDNNALSNEVMMYVSLEAK
ncbi:MAG: YceI family protein [bacterium]